MKTSTTISEEIKAMKFGQNLMIVISLALSMIYACGIDSLTNFEILMYGGILAGLWYVVKLMNDRIEELKSSENQDM